MTNPEQPTREITEQINVFEIDPGYEDSLLRLLYLLDMQGEVKNFQIDIITQSDETGDQRKIAGLKINELCQALGIPPTGWYQQHEESAQTENNYRHDPYSQQTINIAEIDAQPIGTFVTNNAWRALPIEWGPDGEGAFDVTLNMSSGHELLIRADGSYETEYINENPETGEVEDSVMLFEFRFTADIKLPKPTDHE